MPADVLLASQDLSFFFDEQEKHAAKKRPASAIEARPSFQVSLAKRRCICYNMVTKPTTTFQERGLLMKCPTCGQICRTNRETCALCGTPLKQKRGHGGLIFALLVIVALALAGLAAWLLLQPSGSGEADRTAATEALVETVPETSPTPAPRGDVLFTDAAVVYARERYTLALCTDGTLKLAGESASPEFGFDLNEWTGIVQVIPEDYYIFALTRDGRVRMTGEVSGYEAAAQWTNVQRLYYAENGYGINTLLGLTADGRVLAAGPELGFDPSQLSDIVELIPSGDILAVNSEGRVTVLPVLRMLTDAQGLYGVADVALHSDFAFYLMEDGSVRAGSSYYSYFTNNFFYNWNEVQTLRVGDTYLLGLTRDGRVLGDPFQWNEPLPDTAEWSGVIQLELDTERNIAYGVTGDGRVLTASSAEGLAPDLSAWENVAELQVKGSYVVARTADGRVLFYAWEGAPAAFDTADWDGVVSICLSGKHLAALRSDGSVLATGDNSFGQCGPRA